MSRNTDQAQRALREANRIRYARAALRRETAALPYGQGRALVADVLENPPEFVLTARVFDVLRWPRYLGPGHARSILALAGCSDLRRVSELTERQRGVLAERLRAGAREAVAA